MQVSSLVLGGLQQSAKELSLTHNSFSLNPSGTAATGMYRDNGWQDWNTSLLCPSIEKKCSVSRALRNQKPVLHRWAFPLLVKDSHWFVPFFFFLAVLCSVQNLVLQPGISPVPLPWEGKPYCLQREASH